MHKWITPKPVLSLKLELRSKSEKVLENREEIRSIAQNWSVDVFLSVLKYFPEKNFLDFSEEFWSIFRFFAL